MVSPLRVGEVVYLMGDGPLTAVDAKTGKQIYRMELPTQRYRANMLYADEKIYVVGQRGAVTVVQPGREFKILAKNTLPDTLYGSPAVSGGRIYLRGFSNLWAIGTK